MTVQELIEELNRADNRGSAIIEIQTPMGYNPFEIEKIERYKWGVAIVTEDIGCEIDKED